jgi:hypothetical protein
MIVDTLHRFKSAMARNETTRFEEKSAQIARRKQRILQCGSSDDKKRTSQRFKTGEKLNIR